MFIAFSLPKQRNKLLPTSALLQSMQFQSIGARVISKLYYNIEMKASKKVLTYWPCQATQLQQKEYSDVNVAHIVLLGEKSNAAITNCGKKAMGGSVPQVVLDKKLREKKHRFIV